jgi:hypothetical protein
VQPDLLGLLEPMVHLGLLEPMVHLGLLEPMVHLDLPEQPDLRDLLEVVLLVLQDQ